MLLSAKLIIESTIKDLIASQDVNDFYIFAFELRKEDKQNNLTLQLLKDHVKSQVILDIIMSNCWKEESDKIEFVSDKYFHLCTADGHRLTFK